MDFVSSRSSGGRKSKPSSLGQNVRVFSRQRPLEALGRMCFSPVKPLVAACLPRLVATALQSVPLQAHRRLHLWLNARPTWVIQDTPATPRSLITPAYTLPGAGAGGGRGEGKHTVEEIGQEFECTSIASLLTLTKLLNLLELKFLHLKMELTHVQLREFLKELRERILIQILLCFFLLAFKTSLWLVFL